jgi:superfamily I DNA/RNA helicase
MTFSRQAASEMARRVERICKQVLRANSGVLADALAWSGTFCGIGARLLRIYAEQIGHNIDFTIHDREDSADLINLARHELGFSKTESWFPTKGTCLIAAHHALAIALARMLDETGLTGQTIFKAEFDLTGERRNAYPALPDLSHQSRHCSGRRTLMRNAVAFETGAA